MSASLPENLEAILSDLPVAVWEVSLPDLRFTYVSPSIGRLFGHDPARYLDEPGFWLDHIHPEDREQALATCRAASARGEDHTFRYRFLDAGGAYRTVQDVVSVEVDAEGRPRMLRGVFLDVTDEEELRRARLQAEDVLDRVGSASTDIVWVRAAGRILYLSPAYERIWGRSCQSLRDDPSSFLDLVHPEDKVALADVFAEWIGGECEVDAEYRIVRDDGELRVIHARTRLEHGAQGEVLQEVGLATDVTAHRRQEEAQRDAQRLESLGVLAGGIAHDFNNILVSVLGNTDLARAELGEAHPVQPLLDDVLGAARRAADLCQQMLNYSGRGRQRRAPVDLGVELEDLAPLLRSALPPGARLELDDGGRPAWVEADRSQLSQVLLNLVTNAGEALTGGVGEVRLTLEARPFVARELRGLLFSDTLQAGPHVRLVVEDDGCGFPPERLSRSFDPFVSSKGTGRGLGLSTVLGIVRGHGGALRVRSRPERGTTFEVFLPGVEAPEGVEVPPEEPPPAAERPLRVLVVDDEPAVRTLVARVLEREGHRVDAAGSLAEARRRADDAEHDLAVLDIGLPDGDGRDLLAELRARRPELRAVLTSGLTDADTLRARHADAGCAVLPKPFVPEDLLRVVASVRPAPV